MKNLVLISVLFLAACTSAIKDEKSEKENPSSEAMEVVEEFRPEPTENLNILSKEDLIGYWVGWFEPDLTDAEKESLRERDYFPSSNKINISIDRFEGDSVFGHSVVANNNRPFKGTVNFPLNQTWMITVIEPGDDGHDGIFNFEISKGDSLLSGGWVANDSNLNVQRRKFKLSKKVFLYNPSNELDHLYFDMSKHPKRDSIDLVNLLDGRTWEETLRSHNLTTDEQMELMSQEDKLEQLEQIIAEINETEYEFYMVSEASYDVNSSTDSLTSEFVSELSKADIYILRNSIFARHGYSFKKKDLRSYFDRMDWYIPVHANIRTDLTELEKENIKVLLAYEEHAEEYYDSFGR